MIGVDDLLEEMAVAAAEEFAKKAAESLVQDALKFLASKDDIKAAVAQIEAYIGQQFQEFRDDNLIVETMRAIEALSHYSDNPGNKSYLHDAEDHLDAAYSWLEDQITHGSDDVLRMRYVEVVKYVTTNFAVWYARTVIDKKDKPILLKSIFRLTDYLTRAIAQIKDMTKITVSDIQYSHDGDDPTPENPHPIIWQHESFFVSGKLLPGGGYWKDGGPDKNRQVAYNRAVDLRNQIMADYQAAEAKRQNDIYGPAEKLMESLKNIKIP